MKFEPGRKMIVGVGSALVDILAHESDAFLTKAGIPKGGMLLVEEDRIQETLAQLAAVPKIVPGGSACNTVVGVGNLGGAARFIGKCGKGPMGRLIEAGMRDSSVEPGLFYADTPTGRVLSVITPDAQRSMLTYLGASAELLPEEITLDCFANAAVMHVEGYLLFNEALIRQTMAVAKSAGVRVSLDLASFNVVQGAGDLLRELVAEYVDILIANEDEAAAYSGSEDEFTALNHLAQQAPIAVLKLGARGSRIAANGQVVEITPEGDGSAVDTTGAGDLWAAGFLYGLVNNKSLAACGRLGSACGYEVCQVMGATIPKEGWQRIKSVMTTEND